MSFSYLIKQNNLLFCYLKNKNKILIKCKLRNESKPFEIKRYVDSVKKFSPVKRNEWISIAEFSSRSKQALSPCQKLQINFTLVFRKHISSRLTFLKFQFVNYYIVATYKIAINSVMGLLQDNISYLYVLNSNYYESKVLVYSSMAILTSFLVYDATKFSTNLPKLLTWKKLNIMALYIYLKRLGKHWQFLFEWGTFLNKTNIEKQKERI